MGKWFSCGLKKQSTRTHRTFFIKREMFILKGTTTMFVAFALSLSMPGGDLIYCVLYGEDGGFELEILCRDRLKDALAVRLERRR